MREESFRSGDGAYFRALAAQALERGELLEALRDFRIAIEFGASLTPWDLWDFTLAALAAGERGTARRLAALPEKRWTGPDNRPLQLQVRALLELVEDGDDERWTKACLAVRCEEAGILDAIFRRDAAGFRTELVRRAPGFETAGLRRLARERGIPDGP